jgi:hypothetical protein
MHGPSSPSASNVGSCSPLTLLLPEQADRLPHSPDQPFPTLQPERRAQPNPPPARRTAFLAAHQPGAHLLPLPFGYPVLVRAHQHQPPAGQPGGLITFSRWYTDSFHEETSRLFAVAWATLLEEGVKDPENYVAIIRSGSVATLILSNQPFSAADLAKIKSITQTMGYEPLYLPGEPTQIDQIREVAKARTIADLAPLRSASYIDYSPVYDSSPYFFSSVHLVNIYRFLGHPSGAPRAVFAMFFVIQFMIAAGILVAFTIVAPTVWWGKRHASPPPEQSSISSPSA